MFTTLRPLALDLMPSRKLLPSATEPEPVHYKIDDFFDYVKALVTTIIESQANTHIHGDDWQRTIYIDTLSVGTTDFDLSDTMKKKLEDSGIKGAKAYFKWFNSSKSNPANRP